MNVLMIICDQLSSKALRSYGNTYDQTQYMKLNGLLKMGLVMNMHIRHVRCASRHEHHSGHLSIPTKQKC